MTGEDPFLEHVRDLLAGLGFVRAKRMFGGVGLYADDLFFAIVIGDVLYLKADDASEAEFRAAGSQPFQYQQKGGAVLTMRYWRLPDPALDDPEEATRWGRLAVEAARRAAALRASKKKRQPS